MTLLRNALHVAVGTLFLGACAVPGPMQPEVRPHLALRHGGGQAASYYELGRHLHRQARLPEAADALRKAVGLEPGHADAHDELGAVLAALGDVSGAIVHLEKAVELQPLSARYFNNLGYARLLAGDADRAIPAFERAVAFDASNPRAWNNLGLALAAKGDMPRATAAYDRAREIVASAPVAPPVTMPSAPVASVSPDGRQASGPIAVVTGAASVAADVPAMPAAAAGASQAPEPLIVAAPEPVVAAPRLVQVAPNVLELRLPEVAPVQAAAVSPALSPAVLPAALGASPPAIYRLEIANGNGVNGLARRASLALAAQGYPAARLTNQKPFTQRVTEVQYRQGFRAEAEALGARLPGSPAVVAAKRIRSDVRLVLGRDVAREFALLSPTVVAANTTGTGTSE